MEYAHSPRRTASGHQTAQHHRRAARRDAGGRLGPGEGDGQVRPGGRGADALAFLGQRIVRDACPARRLGTPAYMSPEQAEGRLERLGPRSDVYSLGATLYCLLTGQPPFAGEAVDVIRAVQRGEFRRPRQLDSGIDPALEAICLKAMAQRSEDRYSSCRALADDLDRWMADEPVSAWREPFSRRARRWSRRNRTAVTAAGRGGRGRSGRAGRRSPACRPRPTAACEPRTPR